MFEVGRYASLPVPCLVAHTIAVDTMLLMRPWILLTPWIPWLLLRMIVLTLASDNIIDA